MTKVMAVLEFPRVSYFKQNDAGDFDFNFMGTKAGKLFLKTLTAPRAGLGLNINDVDIEFAYDSIPKVYKDGSYANISDKKGKASFDRLRDKMEETKPDLVLAFGGTSCLALIGNKGIGSLRGHPYDGAYKDGSSYTVFPMLNPEDILSSPNKELLLKIDISLIKRFLKGGRKALKPNVGKYELVRDYGRVKEIFTNVLGLAPLTKPKYNIVAVDTETNTIKTWNKGAKPIILSMSWEEHQGVCIPLKHALAPDLWTDEQFNQIKQWILDLFEADQWKVLHNGKYDIRMLMDTYGLKHARKCVDTLIMFWIGVIEERGSVNKGLKDLAWLYTDMGGYEEPLDDFKEQYLKEDYNKWYKKEEASLIEYANKNPLNSGKPRKPKKPAVSNYPGLVNEVDGSKFNYEWIPLDIIYPYAAGDTDACLRIYNKLFDIIKTNPNWVNLVFNVYPKLNDVLCHMEHNGLQIDTDKAEELAKAYGDRLDSVSKQIIAMIPEIGEVEQERLDNLAKRAKIMKEVKPADRTKEQKEFIKEAGKYNGVNPSTGEPKYKVNLGSNNDLAYILYDVLGYELPADPLYLTDSTVKHRVPKEKLTYKNYRVNIEAINYIRDNYDKRLGELLVTYSKTTTALSGFVLKLPALQDPNGRIHTGFNPTGTVTSRLSSSGDFNAQNLTRPETDPRKFNHKYSVKSMIHSRFKGGAIANIDFKSLEVYVMALVSGDHSLTQTLLDNKDVHRRNASVAYGIPEDEVTKDLRTKAKAVD